ncbi:hypothetical protein QEN19_002403 [Hanseniaspora menglaensis]
MFRQTVRLLQQQTKKSAAENKIPTELAPLFVACGVALCSLSYFSYKKLRYDDGLRVLKNPNQSRIDEVLHMSPETEILDLNAEKN